MAIIRPRERVILRSIKYESRIKRSGRRLHKRFRSWTQQRARSFWLPEHISLHTPPELLDGASISAFVQKAATIRKHDYNVWYNCSRRILDIAETLTPQQMGYIFYGFGKSRFLCTDFYDKIIPHVESMLPELYSHPLMCIIWALNRVGIQNSCFMKKYSNQIWAKFDQIRVSDLIKICNSLANLGVNDLKSVLEKNMIEKFQGLFSQEFRASMCDVAILNLYSDSIANYIMSRFPKISICARPQHFQQAYSTAVALRVLKPRIWYELPQMARTFYTRLSMKIIPQASRKPSKLHWDVSNTLAKIGVAHRNTFQWGCYWVDIGESVEKQNCWFIDGPSCFYTGTFKYKEKVKMQHKVMQNLGWNIRRINWYDWAKMKDRDEKVEYIRNIVNKGPMGSELVTPSHLYKTKLQDVQNMLRNIKYAHESGS